MSATAELLQHYKEVHDRLNGVGVFDDGINLRRRKPAPSKPPKLLTVGIAIAKPMPILIRKAVTVLLILKVTADYYKIPLFELRGPSRLRTFCNPRHIAMYLACKHCGYSISHIGSLIGDRDHTTVIHSRDAIAAKVAALDQEIIKVISDIERILYAGISDDPISTELALDARLTADAVS